MAILTIALATLREAARRRLLIALAILTIVVAVLSGWGFHRLLQIPCGEAGRPRPCSATDLKILASTLLLLLMFMFSFVLALGAAFVGAPSISSDVESGVMLAVLPRPIRRSDVVLGKWLGLAVLLALYAGISCGIEFVIGNFAFNYVPPHPILAILFLIGEALVVLTVSLAWSTRLSGITGGVIVLVVFGITWLAGIAGGVGAAVHSRAIQNIGTISSLILPTDGLWRGAIFNLEPYTLLVAQGQLGRAASANPFYASAPATSAYVLWALGWILAVLAITIWSFQRKEL
jgi:ABC-type transport system involved in multi-copper enzyme maturation permease subunit